MSPAKTRAGNFFEDFRVGQHLVHAPPRTVSTVDVALYQGLFGSRFGKRLVYGGHIISMARALSYNGLANALCIAAIHGGRHTAPSFAGDTIYAWSQVLAKDGLPGRSDVGALRVRKVATKDRACHDFPGHDAGAAWDPSVVLDLDYSVLMPRRT